MKIYVYIDPEYRDSLWFSQSYHAICEESAKKKYTVTLLEGDTIYNTDIDELFEGEKKRVLLVLTTSLEHSEKLGEFFYKHNVHMLLVNHLNPYIGANCSAVMVDYTDGMRRLTEYLAACGKKSIALYGINRKSSTDMIKHDFFKNLKQMDPDSPVADIFFNKHGIDECFDYMLPSIDKYDSFICANDIVARSLIQKLSEHGKRVPDDVYVASFGDYLLAKMGYPPLTTVSVDHEELGRQALFAYNYLRKSDHKVYMTAKVPSTLHVRRSTDDKMPEILPSTRYIRSSYGEYLDFLNDEECERILNVENMLAACDKLDLQIISGLLKKVPYSKMAVGLFISENVIFYRIKRLTKAAGVQNKEELIALINEFLSPDEISEYLGLDSMSR